MPTVDGALETDSRADSPARAVTAQTSGNRTATALANLCLGLAFFVLAIATPRE